MNLVLDAENYHLKYIKISNINKLNKKINQVANITSLNQLYSPDLPLCVVGYDNGNFDLISYDNALIYREYNKENQLGIIKHISGYLMSNMLIIWLCYQHNNDQVEYISETAVYIYKISSNSHRHQVKLMKYMNNLIQHNQEWLLATTYHYHKKDCRPLLNYAPSIITLLAAQPIDNDDDENNDIVPSFWIVHIDIKNDVSLTIPQFDFIITPYAMNHVTYPLLNICIDPLSINCSLKKANQFLSYSRSYDFNIECLYDYHYIDYSYLSIQKSLYNIFYKYPSYVLFTANRLPPSRTLGYIDLLYKCFQTGLYHDDYQQAMNIGIDGWIEIDAIGGLSTTMMMMMIY